MRGSRYGYRPRTKKIRNPITVKDRVAKKGGRCAACKLRYEIGDKVTVVRVKRRTYHQGVCVPANAAQMPSVPGSTIAGLTADHIAKSLSVSWTVGEASMVALAALENALIVRIKRGDKKIDPEMEKAFDRYNKLKGMALRPGSDNEGRMAVLQAMKSLVSLVWAN